MDDLIQRLNANERRGSKRAVPRLTEMLRTGNAKALPIVVRALGKVGDAKTVDSMLPLLARPEPVAKPA